MGTPAIIEVVDDERTARFRMHWASPRYQIQYLADFIHWLDADRAGRLMDVNRYVEFATTLGEGKLPAEVVTHIREYADADYTSGLDYRYQLTLSQRDRSFRFTAHSCDSVPTPIENLATRAELYGAAARMARQMANLTRQYAAHNGGYTPSSMAPAEVWDGEADRFTWWQAAAAEPVVEATPEPEPVAPIKVGDLVISKNYDGVMRWGGRSDSPQFEQVKISFSRSEPSEIFTSIRNVAPADITIPERDERVVVQKGKKPGPWVAGDWALTLPGYHPSWHRIKADGVKKGLRVIAIIDWWAAYDAANPIAAPTEAAPEPEADPEPEPTPEPVAAYVDTRPWVAWGKHPSYAGGVPIKLSAGTLPQCRTEVKTREGEGGWSGLAILAQGAQYDPDAAAEVPATTGPAMTGQEAAGMAAFDATFADQTAAHKASVARVGLGKDAEPEAAADPEPVADGLASAARTVEILRKATWSLEVVRIKGQATGMDVLKLNSGYLNYKTEFMPVAEVANSLGGAWHKLSKGFIFKPSEARFSGGYTTPGRDKLNAWLERNAPADENAPAPAEVPVSETEHDNEEKPVTDNNEGNNSAEVVDPRIAEWVSDVTAMIEEDITGGRVPASVTCFSQLHSYLDANDYTQAVEVPWGADIASDDDQAGVKLVNAVEEAVSRWLVERIKEKGRKADQGGRPVTYTDDGLAYVVDGGRSWYVTQCCGATVGESAMGPTHCEECYDEADERLAQPAPSAA